MKDYGGFAHAQRGLQSSKAKTKTSHVNGCFEYCHQSWVLASYDHITAFQLDATCKEGKKHDIPPNSSSSSHEPSEFQIILLPTIKINSMWCFNMYK
jgi:hypothetical protein